MNVLKTIEARHIREALDLAEDLFYLDVGCASGRQFVHYARHCNFSVGVDINESSARKTHELIDLYGNNRLHALACDAARLPFKDSSFDRILCGDIISIAQYPVQILQECLRVLRKGGRIIICNGRGYETIDRFYHSRNWIIRLTRFVLIKLTPLPDSLLGFYRSRTSQNVAIDDPSFGSRLSDLDGFLLRVIEGAGGLAYHKSGAIHRPSEIFLSLIQILTCVVNIPAELNKYIFIPLLPLFLLFERLPPLGKSLAVIYVVRKD